MARTTTKGSGTASKAPATKAAKPATATKRVARRRPTQATIQQHGDGGALSGLVLAIVLGALGFVASIFWIASMLVMALLLGLMLANRRNASSSKGVVSELVAAVVDEVKDISESS